MKTWPRILLNLLGPVAIAAPLMALTLTLFDTSSFRFSDLLGAIGLFVVYGYVLALIPSALHTAFMEWVYRRRATSDRWRAVGYSTVSGFMAGAGLALLGRELTSTILFAGTGIATGFLLGLVIRRLSRRKNGEGSPPL